METKRIGQGNLSEKRGKERVATDFYAVELAEGARYLRRVTNVSDDGLSIQSPLADERPGQTVNLELPRIEGDEPLRVRGEVVYVKDDGRVGVRVTGERLPVDSLGGREAL